jgi:hypothetical protein
VILVREPREQLRPGLAAEKAERRQRVAHDQDVTVGQAQGRASGGVAGVWMTRGRPGTSRTSPSPKPDASATGAVRATPLRRQCATTCSTGGFHSGYKDGLPLRTG